MEEDHTIRSATFDDRLKVVADLHAPKFSGAVLPNLVGFTDGDVVGGHGPHRTRIFLGKSSAVQMILVTAFL